VDAPRYHLVRTIASGGMAHVYEAVARGERGFERRVAIKRVLPEHAHDVSMRRMFFDEARIASHLHHGSIVQILDYGVVDGAEFIAMEYVDGVDAGRAVAQAMRQGRPMPEALALHVAAEIAHALAYAHERTDPDGAALQIVHRDVSPGNILMSWDGDVKLSDFGIALATAREEKTATGVVKGKLAYMAPEQAGGRPVTAAADVYALGATLCALLTGAPPGAPKASDLDVALTHEVEDLARACMEPDAASRPETSAVAFRAGQLAARRLDRDTRGALREWLAPLRATMAKVSALDDLMGLALVASGDGRNYTVSRIADPPQLASTVPVGAYALRESQAPTARMVAKGAAPASASSTDLIRLPIRRTGLIVVAALVVGVAIVGGAAFVVSTDRATERSAATDDRPPGGSGEHAEPIRADAPPAHDAPGTSGHAQARGPEPAAPSSESTIAVRSPGPTAEHDRRAVATRAGRHAGPAEPAVAPEGPEPSVPPRPPPPVDPAGSQAASVSHVRVPRGAGAQERIRVDGVAAGFTPTVLRLTPGRHRVVIDDVETGAVLLDQTISAGAHHTRVAPLVLRR